MENELFILKETKRIDPKTELMHNEETSCIKFVINYKVARTVNNMNEVIEKYITNNTNNAIKTSDVKMSPSLSNLDIKSL